jgi:hypothetical protein
MGQINGKETNDASIKVRKNKKNERFNFKREIKRLEIGESRNFKAKEIGAANARVQVCQVNSDTEMNFSASDAGLISEIKITRKK